MNFHGIISLCKPPGMTSHDAVAHVRRVLKTKRVGHTGTLDPAASGVLLICVGQATRLVEALQSGTKEYLAEATFGYETDTLDAVGRTVRTDDRASLQLEDVERACARFRGVIEQEPPMHSAIKVGGQKLYDLARAGGEASQKVKIPLRSVTISDLQVTRFFAATSTRPYARAFLRIECSGGTYIRSLVRDIGRALEGEGAATMTFLSRVRGGEYDLAAAVTPQEFEQEPVLIGISQVLRGLYGPALVDNAMMLMLWQGRRVEYKPLVDIPNRAGAISSDAPLLCSNEEGTLMALATCEEADESKSIWRASKAFDLR